jgi:hypothetical protein
MNTTPTPTSCAHMKFEAVVHVDRLEDSGRFVACVNVRCSECGTRFQWQGLRPGLDLEGCMVSVDGFELRGAIKPDAHMTSIMAGDERTKFPQVRGFTIIPSPDPPA